MKYKIISVEALDKDAPTKFDKTSLIGEIFEIEEYPDVYERFSERHGRKYLTTTPIEMITLLSDGSFVITTKNTIYTFERINDI